MTVNINEANRRIIAIAVQIHPPLQSDGIGAEPAAEPGDVVAGVVVGESAFLIPFHSGIAVAFGRGFDGFVPGQPGGIPVGREFLLADEDAGLVHFDRR